MTLLELTAYFYFQQEEWRPFIETFPLSAIDEDTSRWMNRSFDQEEVLGPFVILMVTNLQD